MWPQGRLQVGFPSAWVCTFNKASSSWSTTPASPASVVEKGGDTHPIRLMVPVDCMDEDTCLRLEPG